MTEKRGTGNEYGQDKLKDRAENYDLAGDEKKPKSKLKVLGILIVTLIGAGALYPVVFGGNTTPAEKSEEVVALNSNGVSVEDSKTSIPPAVSDADKAAADKAAADKAAADKAAADKAAADKASADKATNDPDKELPAILHSSTPDKAVGSFDADAESRLLDIAAPANPSAEIVSAEQVRQKATGKLPPEDVKGIADAVIHDPTVKATDEAKKVSELGATVEHYDASKFGIGANSGSATNPSPTSQPAQQVVNSVAPSENPSSEEMLKSYTGQSTEAFYHTQSQNTVYVYGSFAAKVYLLPLGKNEKINAYLSDAKGWELTQLPGNILRIKRSANKANWSDATDLFLVAGKRTYTLILQAVDQPKLRTDSLRYLEPTTAKSGKK